MIRIAIDGPGGAGKSTIAKLVGDKLGLEYIDTGAMYRAVGLKLNREGIKPDDLISISNVLEETTIDFVNGKIILDGDDVSDIIRTQEISKFASIYSQIPEVRSKLVDIQRRIAAGKSVIMDGRDIGTNVLTDAELKVFLTADSMVRARRRYEELRSKGVNANLDDIHEEIKDRDYQDMNRKLNPLVQAEDAVMLDTSDMTIDEVVNTIVAMAARGYCYLIFLFDILILFHSEIAEFFGTTDKKILYGFTAIILFQAVLSVLYVVKYVTTVGQKDKKRKEIIMYAARLRYCFMAMLVFLAGIICNYAVADNIYVEKALIMMLVMMLLLALKNLTILQRGRY